MPSIITFLTKVCCLRICSRLLCSTPSSLSRPRSHCGISNKNPKSQQEHFRLRDFQFQGKPYGWRFITSFPVKRPNIEQLPVVHARTLPSEPLLGHMTEGHIR
jgi:hypothetical protein